MHTPYLRQCWQHMQQYYSSSDSQSYSMLPDGEHLEKDRIDAPAWTQNGYFSRQKRQRRLAYSGAILLIVIFLGSVLAHHPSYTTKSYQEPQIGHLRLLAPTTRDLLVPKAEMNTMMCKSLLSSLATGYPAPTLINYNVAVEKNFFSLAGGTHMLKIKGVRDYLRTLEPQYDNDVAIVYDATDTWFQLPPEVMLSRYLELRRDANARLSKRFGRAARLSRMSEEVFFSVQKGCGVNSDQHNATGCHTAPESSLATDIFGPDTDGVPPPGSREHILRRPRWTNSGFAIGTVAALREVYTMAFWLQYHGVGRQNGGSDQFIITELVGMQNAWRHVQAEKQRGWTDNLSSWFADSVGRSSKPSENIDWHNIYNLSADPHLTYELGLGLDEASRLSQVTWSFEKELEWTKHDDPAALTKLYHDRGLTDFADKGATVPADVQAVRNPFAAIMPQPADDSTTNPTATPPHSNETWAGVPLVTNLYTGEVPASVHMCGLDWKARVRTHWDKPWFHTRIRSLLDAAAMPASPSLGVTVVDGKSREWFGRDVQGGFLGTDRRPEEVPLTDVCGSHWDVLLDDKNGAWVNPAAAVE